MRMNTYVNFRGKCAEAFRYYERHLGAKVGMMMTHAQSPDQSPVGPEWKDAVLHARISIGDTELMAADIPNAEPMRSAYLTLRMDSLMRGQLRRPPIVLSWIERLVCRQTVKVKSDSSYSFQFNEMARPA